MTTTQWPQKGGQTLTPTLSSLSSMSTLWVPLNETIEQWAAFARSALTAAALQAVGTAFHGLAWETEALHHATRAVNEHRRRKVRWLGYAVQDLDCALDQWQQALSWLELADTDGQQREQTGQQTLRHLTEQAGLHQDRRRLLHRQVLEEYSSARKQGCTPHVQQSEKGR
jgi:hypothetical protein